MTENDLLLKIEGLEKVIQEKNDAAIYHTAELKQTKQELIDYNKPELTPQQVDDIERAVEQAVSQFDFTDTDNYEIDYSLDYDGRVQCESHEFINDSDLVDMIVTKVCSLFKEADCPEDDNSQVNTQTIAEKII
tara:strand:+ start:84 stop:485 length:402 start_codon:yes stop_codon:yes gene_type:complete